MSLEQLPAFGFASGEEVVAGKIDTTTPTILKGSGFTVAKNALGDVTVTFTKPFSDVPVITTTTQAGGAGGCNMAEVQITTTPTATVARFRLVTQVGPALYDGIFHFIAYIPGAAVTRAPRDFGLVTALPTTPTPQTGDYCSYSNSLTAPTYRWMLQYNGSSSSAYKWECIGGSSFANTAPTQRGVTATGALVAMPTDPITFNLPLAGDYDITQSFTVNNTASAAFLQVAYSLAGSVGGASYTTGWGILAFNSTASLGATFERRWRHTGLAASTAIQECASGSGGTHTVGARRIEAMPVRVG